MINHEFFFLINMCMLSRMFFVLNDHPLSIRQLLIMVSVQVVSLLVFEFEVSLGLLLAFLITFNGIYYYLESDLITNYIRGRILYILIMAVSLGFFVSPAMGISFDPGLRSLASEAEIYFYGFEFLRSYNIGKLNLIVSGMLFMVNEANLLVRLLLRASNMEPVEVSPEGKLDEAEYNAGRVIGILERELMYIFGLSLNFTAVAFIMAAKGFARFRDLDKRPFAEYVLTGTLASTLIAILAALVVNSVN